MRFLILLIASHAIAAPVDFVREVRPLFQEHCYGCHGEKKQKSGLRLDIKSEAFKGGDRHAPDILPGNAAASPLIHALTTDDEEERMPPKGRLRPADIQLLTNWIQQGAPWPDGVDTAKLEDRRDHWSFKPLRPSSGGSIDAFIDAQLREHGLTRSPQADPVTWLRRVTLDLTGLPPTPEELAAFLTDRSPETVVDRLLASPRYGEHWGQLWLDVVRYADTHGFEVNTERPHAWPYRDYVIRAFNRDTPYDRFIQEQLVGDALGEDAATGFLVTASVLLPGQIGKDEASKRLARQDALDEIVVNIGQSFLGLSIGCARCHDHKFDPITARDYYAMQAFVAGVEYADRELKTPAALATRQRLKDLQGERTKLEQQLARLVPRARSGVTRPRIQAQENHDRFTAVKTRRLRFTIQATQRLEPCVDEIEVFNTAGENIARQAHVTASGETVVADRHELRFINDGQYGNSRSWMSNTVGHGWVVLDFPRQEEIDRVVWSRDRQGQFKDRLATRYLIEVANASGSWQSIADSEDRRREEPAERSPSEWSSEGLSAEEAATARQLQQKKRQLEAQLPALEAAHQVFAGTFRTPDAIHLLHRGDPEQPREPVVPAVLAALGDIQLPAAAPEQKRRQALADWITRPDHPLTARVIVNRLWQGHFGTGLVDTPSDLGRSGTKPSHPDLLDWLAAEFIRGGWSMKRLHRLIVLSQTYRQSSSLIGRASPTKAKATAAEIDVEARLLWRFPSRRLTAESIRDSMLAVSGQLNLAMYGRGYDLFDKRGGLTGFEPIETFTPANQRRMIYAHKVRREPESVFGAFDCPDAGQSTAIRRSSTTPVQALNLFNSRFTLVQAEAFAQRLIQEVGSDVTRQIQRAYRLALNREPTAAEISEMTPFIQQHGLPPFTRALFNSNEFLWLP